MWVLFALAERQSAVRSLMREVAILARYQGGVRGEMDRIHDELNLAAAVQGFTPRGFDVVQDPIPANPAA